MRRAASLTLGTVWTLLPPLICLLLLDMATIPPNDFWWHLRTGQIISQTGVIPNVDLFSFTRSGMPWTNQCWLMQVWLYVLYQVGNLPLVLFGHALTITAGYTCLQLACLQRAPANRRAAGLATLAAVLLGMTQWTVRPQAASFLCFGFLVLVIERDRARGTRLMWSLPLLFAVWANLHGGFVFGLGLLALYAISRAIEDLIATRGRETGAGMRLSRLQPGTRRVLRVALLSLAGLAANPGGPAGIVRYVLGFFTSKATQEINVEFMPLNARDGGGAFFIGFVVALLLLLYVRQRRLPVYPLAAALIFGLYALYSRRLIPWFGMALAPSLAWAVPGPARTSAQPAGRREKVLLNYLLLAIIVTSGILTLPWLRPALSLPPERRGYLMPHSTPVAAAQALCALGPNLRTFSEIGYASYLTWACPAAPVFIDTRFELYPTELWQDYLEVSDGRFGWQDTLARYGVNAILARKDTQSSLVTAAKASGAWQTEYEDDETYLAIRR